MKKWEDFPTMAQRPGRAAGWFRDERDKVLKAISKSGHVQFWIRKEQFIATGGKIWEDINRDWKP